MRRLLGGIAREWVCALALLVTRGVDDCNVGQSPHGEISCRKPASRRTLYFSWAFMSLSMINRADVNGRRKIRRRIRRLRINRRVLAAFRTRYCVQFRAEGEERRPNPVALLAAIAFNAGIVVLLGHAPYGRSDRREPITEEVAYQVSLKPVEVFIREEQPSPPDTLSAPLVPRPVRVTSADAAPLSPARPPPVEPQSVYVPPFVRSGPRVPVVVMSQAHQQEPQPHVLRETDADLPLAAEAEAGVRGLLADYWENVRSRVSAHLRYPLAARQRQAEGTVVVEIVLDEEGRLVNVRPIAEPREPSLTHSVVSSVRKASPFGRPKFLPQDVATNLVGTIAVRFDLVDANTNGQQEEEQPGF
ncbi:MAG: TonB family protein [Kiritimatiellae bacterium]|nr:TonB family protein [Kiritimatiellia bacterium]